MIQDTQGLKDLFGFVWSGKLREARELIDAIATRDVSLILDELGDIAELFGFTGADLQLNQLAAAIKLGSANWAGIASEATDVLKIVFEKFRTMPPAPAFSIMAAPHVDDMTRAQSRLFYSENRANIRKGATSRAGRWSLNGADELLNAFASQPGEMTATLKAIDPERLARIVEIARKAIPWLTVFAAVPMLTPYLLPLLSAVRLFVVWYDSTHPTAGAIANDDRGLSLEDLAS